MKVYCLWKSNNIDYTELISIYRVKRFAEQDGKRLQKTELLFCMYEYYVSTEELK